MTNSITMPYNKTLEEGLREFDEKFQEGGFTKEDAAYCEDAQSRSQGCWKLKHIKSFLTSFAEKIREGVVEEALESFCNMVKNELRLQKMDGFSLDGTDFDAVFNSAKKTLLAQLKT